MKQELCRPNWAMGRGVSIGRSRRDEQRLLRCTQFAQSILWMLLVEAGGSITRPGLATLAARLSTHAYQPTIPSDNHRRRPHVIMITRNCGRDRDPKPQVARSIGLSKVFAIDIICAGDFMSFDPSPPARSASDSHGAAEEYPCSTTFLTCSRPMRYLPSFEPPRSQPTPWPRSSSRDQNWQKAACLPRRPDSRCLPTRSDRERTGR